jgi:hypothetical protein
MRDFFEKAALRLKVVRPEIHPLRPYNFGKLLHGVDPLPQRQYYNILDQGKTLSHLAPESLHPSFRGGQQG